MSKGKTLMSKGKTSLSKGKASSLGKKVIFSLQNM